MRWKRLFGILVLCMLLAGCTAPPPSAPAAAFAFAKLQFRGRETLFYGDVLALLLPSQVLCVPLTMDALVGYTLGHRAAGDFFAFPGFFAQAVF